MNFTVRDFFRPDQAEEELQNCLNLAIYVLTTLGLQNDVTYRLSKWDPQNTDKYLGDEAYWESTQGALRQVLQEKGIPFEEAEGLVSVRSRFAGDEGQKTVSEFVDAITKEIREKTIREELVEE